MVPCVAQLFQGCPFKTPPTSQPTCMLGASIHGATQYSSCIITSLSWFNYDTSPPTLGAAWTSACAVHSRQRSGALLSAHRIIQAFLSLLLCNVRVCLCVCCRLTSL